MCQGGQGRTNTFYLPDWLLSKINLSHNHNKPSRPHIPAPFIHCRHDNRRRPSTSTTRFVQQVTCPSKDQINLNWITSEHEKTCRERTGFQLAAVLVGVWFSRCFGVLVGVQVGGCFGVQVGVCFGVLVGVQVSRFFGVQVSRSFGVWVSRGFGVLVGVWVGVCFGVWVGGCFSVLVGVQVGGVYLCYT